MSDYNSGLVNLPSSSVINSTPTQQTVLAAVAERHTGAGTSTLGTVGAGKRWRIIGFYMSETFSGANFGTDQLQIDGSAVAIMSYAGAAGNVGQTVGISQNFPYNCGLIAAAGKEVSFVQGYAGWGAAGIYYIEETV